MATSPVSPNADELINEIQIAAPPDRVFQALIDPNQVLKWWGKSGVYWCAEYQNDLRVGGKWRSAGFNADGRKFEVVGEYLKIDPPRQLVHSWIATWTGDAKTTVSWELEPAANGTLLRIRHSGLSAYPELAKSYQGWPQMLGWLQALLERGETVADRKPPASPHL
jgi:uncharacterized protein YndB with AHSA1/START domain